jgi:hypothetical protein
MEGYTKHSTGMGLNSMVAKSKDEASTDVVKTDFSTVNSWEEAFDKVGVPVYSADIFGDGFPLIDKSKLLGLEFVMLDFSYVKASDVTEKVYVNVRAMRRDGVKFCFNDGGTGVMAQCAEFENQTGRRGGLVASRGLRVSRYTNEHGDAETYYFN